MELAIYCLSRALESFALCLVDWGIVRRRRGISQSDGNPSLLTLGACLHG